jgi:hypothetical protein
MRAFLRGFWLASLLVLGPAIVRADDAGGPWITIRLENATQETQVSAIRFSFDWWCLEWDWGWHWHKYQDTRPILSGDWRYAPGDSAVYLRCRPLQLERENPRIELTVSNGRETRLYPLSLSGSPPHVIRLPDSGPVIPAADELKKLGVDSRLAPYATLTERRVRAPGYKAVPFDVVDHRVVPRPPKGRFEPIRLNVRLTVAGSNRQLAVARVKVLVGGVEVLDNPGDKSLSLADILAPSAGNGYVPAAVLNGNRVLSLEPVLDASLARYFAAPGAAVVSADRLAPADGGDIDVPREAPPRPLQVQISLPAGLKAWPRSPSVWVDDGRPGAEWLEVKRTAFQDGAIAASPGTVEWARPPESIRFDLGPAFDRLELSLAEDSVWTKTTPWTPAIVGWEVVAPSAAFPPETMFRITPPGSAEPVVLDYDTRSGRARLPEGLAWARVAGGAVEIRSPGRRPLLFPAVDSPRIDAAAAAQRLDAEASADARNEKPQGLRPYVMAMGAAPAVLVINDAGVIAARTLEAEIRIRQSLTDLLRHLVDGAKQARCLLKTLARLGPGQGNWPDRTTSELLDTQGEVPFAPSGRDRDSRANLAEMLHRIVQTPGAGDLADRLVIIVVAPYRRRAENASDSSRWLEATVKQLRKKRTNVDLQTVVVGVPPYVSDAELARSYPHPHRLETGDEIDIIEGARATAERVLQAAGLKPAPRAVHFPTTIDASSRKAR